MTDARSVIGSPPHPSARAHRAASARSGPRPRASSPSSARSAALAASGSKTRSARRTYTQPAPDHHELAQRQHVAHRQAVDDELAAHEVGRVAGQQDEAEVPGQEEHRGREHERPLAADQLLEFRRPLGGHPVDVRLDGSSPALPVPPARRQCVAQWSSLLLHLGSNPGALSLNSAPLRAQIPRAASLYSALPQSGDSPDRGSGRPWAYVPGMTSETRTPPPSAPGSAAHGTRNPDGSERRDTCSCDASQPPGGAAPGHARARRRGHGAHVPLRARRAAARAFTRSAARSSGCRPSSRR